MLPRSVLPPQISHLASTSTKQLDAQQMRGLSAPLFFAVQNFKQKCFFSRIKFAFFSAKNAP